MEPLALAAVIGSAPIKLHIHQTELTATISSSGLPVGLTTPKEELTDLSTSTNKTPSKSHRLSTDRPQSQTNDHLSKELDAEKKTNFELAQKRKTQNAFGKTKTTQSTTSIQKVNMKTHVELSHSKKRKIKE